MSNAVREKIVDLKPHQSPLSPQSFGLLEGLGQCGAAFGKVRVAALQSLAAHGLPSPMHELWRYTTPAMLKLELSAHTRAAQSTSPSSLPKGVEVLRGAAAFEALNAARKFETDTPEAMTLGDLCDATCSDILVVKIAAGVRLSAPVKLSTLAQISSADAVEGCGSRLLGMIVGKNSEGTIINDLSGNGKGLELERVELILEAGARGNFVHIQHYGDEVRFYGRHRIFADRDVDFTCLHIALGSRVARLDLDLILAQPGSSVNLLGVSVVDQKRHVDFHPNQRHLAPQCRSDLFLKTVVKEKGRSVYYGYIKVAEGAQKTDAYQTNRNLLLSKDARADTIPNLEIKANDVKCSHGASVTHVGEEEMFYLQARGLTAATAERLLVGGFLEDVLGRFSDEVIRAELSELIANRLDK